MSQDSAVTFKVTFLVCKLDGFKHWIETLHFRISLSVSMVSQTHFPEEQGVLVYCH